jgi:hypothetical protein
MDTERLFSQNVALATLMGLFSILVAVVSGSVAHFTARSNFRQDLVKMRAQIAVQRKAEGHERIATLRQRYLTPLRYYASTWSTRFAELDTKF